MVQKRKWLVVMTAAGLIATTAAVGASGIAEKVNGWLRPDIAITVEGSDTAIQPVIIDGKTYLPVRDMAAAMGYTVEWRGSSIDLQQLEEAEEADYMVLSGIIVSAEKQDDKVRLETLGYGPNGRLILFADAETVITDANGAALDASALQPGMAITAEYGPFVALSYPAQSHAASIQIGEQRLVKEEAILGAERTDDGWKIAFGDPKDGDARPSLILNAGKETMLVNAEGQPADWSQLKPGTNVRAYYGPMMTKSLPPQSPAHIVVLVDLHETFAPAEIAEYRELAWKYVPEEEKDHLITKKEEAGVDLVDANTAMVMPQTDEQKQRFADLQAEGGKLVAVMYNTDQDALIGPLIVALHPETKELLGYFQRL